MSKAIDKKKACSFVFDCLKGNICCPVKNYFNFVTDDFDTRNSKTTIALQKMKLDFAWKKSCFPDFLNNARKFTCTMISMEVFFPTLVYWHFFFLIIFIFYLKHTYRTTYTLTYTYLLTMTYNCIPHDSSF